MRCGRSSDERHARLRPARCSRRGGGSSRAKSTTRRPFASVTYASRMFHSSRHRPVEDLRARRHLVHLERDVLADAAQRLADAVAGDAPADREEVGDELVQLLAAGRGCPGGSGVDHRCRISQSYGMSFSNGSSAGRPSRIMRVCAAVGNQCVRVAHALEAAPDTGRDHDERVVVGAEEHLLHGTVGRRAVPVVEEDELDPAVHAGVVQRHLDVPVPALDDARVDRGEVDLAEAAEVRSRPRGACAGSFPRSSGIRRSGTISTPSIALAAVTGPASGSRTPRPGRSARSTPCPGGGAVASEQVRA